MASFPPVGSVPPKRPGIRILALLLGAVGLAAGCDADGPVDPAPEDEVEAPAALEVQVSDPVIEGEPFTLTVRALDADSALAEEWSGRVMLEVSAGTLAPDTVEVVDGVAEFQATLSEYAGTVVLTAAVATGVRVEASVSFRVLSAADPVRIELVPGAVLLPGEGETAVLKARAYDAQDRLAAVDVVWRSSDPAAVSVTSNGTLTAEAALGSAQITAEAAGVTSAPVLVLVAEPADDAVLVADSQVVGEVEPVGSASSYGPGWRYRVTLHGVDSVQVGDVLVGIGERPVAGRVVGVAGTGAERDVTLELLAMRELVQNLSVEETISLDRAEAELAPQAEGSYRLERSPDGALRVVPRAAGAALSPEDLRLLVSGETEFALGPFECTAVGEVPDLAIEAPDYTITPDLTLDFVYQNGLEHLGLRGTLEAEFAFRPVYEVSAEGEVSCKAEIVSLRLPIGGPLALFVGGQVPLGVGLDLGAALSAGGFGFDLAVGASVDAELGVGCAGEAACELLQLFEMSADGSFEPIYPAGLNEFRAELSGYPHAFAGLTVGAAFSEDLQFELVTADAGLKQEIDWATTEGQAADTVYASTFRLLLRAEAGPGEAMESALGLLDIQADAVTFEYEDTLARSPRGTITAAPSAVAPRRGDAPGDTLTFTVELDPVTYLGAYAVDSVSIYWNRVSEEDDTIFEPAPGPCASMAASEGQTTFTCRTDLPEAKAGPQRFYAFVHSPLFGIPLPAPNEIDEDGHVEVTLEALEVTVSPDSVVLEPGETHPFTASVTGTTDTTVTWSATGGTVTDDGLYTAGDEPGTYEVVAASVVDPDVTGRAVVTINEPGGRAVATAVEGYVVVGAAVFRKVDRDSTERVEQLDTTFADPGSVAGFTADMSAQAAAYGASANAEVSYTTTLERDASTGELTGVYTTNRTSVAVNDPGTDPDVGAGGGSQSDVRVIFEVQDAATRFELTGECSYEGEFPLAEVDVQLAEYDPESGDIGGTIGGFFIGEPGDDITTACTGNYDGGEIAPGYYALWGRDLISGSDNGSGSFSYTVRLDLVQSESRAR